MALNSQNRRQLSGLAAFWLHCPRRPFSWQVKTSLPLEIAEIIDPFTRWGHKSGQIDLYYKWMAYIGYDFCLVSRRDLGL
ncbi:MAG: hypothetical protein ACK5YR_11440 [Pirellula sp.]|jgi:hypothetical protein